MTKKIFINHLCKNILSGRFDWEKYLSLKSYFGKQICTTPLHASYGLVGFSVYFPYNTESFPKVEYDIELKRLTIDGQSLQQWLSVAG